MRLFSLIENYTSFLGIICYLLNFFMLLDYVLYDN